MFGTLKDLHDWMIAHLREEHLMMAHAEQNGGAPDSFADLKAAHDLLHSFQPAEPETT